MDIKELEILGDSANSHWYYRSKAKAVLTLLTQTRQGVNRARRGGDSRGGVGEDSPTARSALKKILDIGAGSGFFSKHLLAHRQAKEAWCVDINYAEDSDEGSIYYRRSLDRSNADTVLLIDVLEHVDDDIALLAEYVAKVPSGSRFLISVPAFMFLWSGHDVFLEHKRRYTLLQIEAVARAAGLNVTRGCYYFGLVLPIAALLRLVQRFGRQRPPGSQLARHHPLVNALLTFLCDLELRWMTHNRLGGLSAFCLAEKP